MVSPVGSRDALAGIALLEDFIGESNISSLEFSLSYEMLRCKFLYSTGSKLETKLISLKIIIIALYQQIFQLDL